AVSCSAPTSLAARSANWPSTAPATGTPPRSPGTPRRRRCCGPDPRITITPMTEGADSRDQAALVRAFLAARDGGDAALTEQAARQLPRGQRFGMHPGQLPGLLHAEYQKATDPVRRCGLAAALARAWVYGGYAERARAFAEEAPRLSAGLGDPAVAADALDA